MKVFACVFEQFVKLFIFAASVHEYFTIQYLLLVFNVDTRICSWYKATISFWQVCIFYIKITS